MNFLKFACISIFFLVSGISIEAAWNPTYLALENEKALEVLDHPDLHNLQNKVSAYVKNSWCSQEKARLILELVVITHPSVCVEIGAFTGSSTLPLLVGLKYTKEGKAYIIDAWSNEAAIQGLPSKDPNTGWWAGLKMQEIQGQFAYMLNSWNLRSFCHTIQKSSDQAISEIPPIDFLHIDGNFSEEGALKDSELYLPKVTPGGYILISNVLVMIDQKPTKMKALWPLFEYCSLICELDQGNTLLFRKNKG